MQDHGEGTVAYERALTLKAMREKERQEALALERLLSDEDRPVELDEAWGSGGEAYNSDFDGEEDFDREMQLVGLVE